MKETDELLSKTLEEGLRVTEIYLKEIKNEITPGSNPWLKISVVIDWFEFFRRNKELIAASPYLKYALENVLFIDEKVGGHLDHEQVEARAIVRAALNKTQHME